MEAGHYKAYSYSESRVVRQFDDMGVNGIPLFLQIEDDQVQRELENAYILFYELLPAGEEVADLIPPLKTPLRAEKVQQQSHTLEHQSSKNPQLNKFMSPEASQSPKIRRLQAYQEDLERQNKIHFFNGCVDDVIFVGKEGEVWSRDNLLNFFVVIPGSTILQFRVAHKSVGELKTEELLEHLLKPTGLPFNVPPFKNKLYYKDAQLKPEVNLLSFSADKKGIGNVTFILEQHDFKLLHSGLLFTCEDCEGEETSFEDDNKKLLMGATRYERYEPKHDGHKLMYADLFKLEENTKNSGSKKNWGIGKSRDKNNKPWGCPKDQPAAAPQKVVSQAPDGVQSQDSSGSLS